MEREDRAEAVEAFRFEAQARANSTATKPELDHPFSILMNYCSALVVQDRSTISKKKNVLCF
jgi:hypothetical protein